MSADGKKSAIAHLIEDAGRFPPKDLAKRILGKISDDDIPTLSAAFAYHWTFSLPPLILLTVLLAALLNTVTSVPVVENLRDLINDHAPSDTRQMLTRIVDKAVEQVSGNVASLGVVLAAVIALWSASNAVNILIIGFNRAYGVIEERPMLRRKALSFGLTLLLVLFINVAFALLVFGKQIGEWIADWVGLGRVFDIVWAISRWPAAILGIMLVLAVLYWAAPNVEQSFRWITVGSAVATLLWLVVVAGFGIYLNYSNPGSAYGVVGSVIVLLFFLNLTGMVFFLGAEINAILYHAVAERPVGMVKGPKMVVANQ
jgi:membrane protein